MNRHSCPSSGAVLGLDATAVHLGYGLVDGESQTGTPLLARSGFIDAIGFLRTSPLRSSTKFTRTPRLSQPVIRIYRHRGPFRGSATVPTISFFPEP